MPITLQQAPPPLRRGPPQDFLTFRRLFSIVAIEVACSSVIQESITVLWSNVKTILNSNLNFVHTYL